MGGRKLRFCKHDFSDYREKKNSARREAEEERMSITKTKSSAQTKSRNSLFFNVHNFTHIYYLSTGAGLVSKRQGGRGGSRLM